MASTGEAWEETSGATPGHCHTERHCGACVPGVIPALLLIAALNNA
jgi:hypothetical protein